MAVELYLSMTDRSPRLVDDFKRADHAASVIWSNPMRRQRIDLAKSLTQRFDAVSLDVGFDRLAEIPIGGWAGVKAAQDSF